MKLPATTTCVRWCIMVVAVAVAVAPSFAVGYTTVPFKLEDGGEGYSIFMTLFRSSVAAAARPCGLPSTQINPPAKDAYIYVDLKFSDTQWVTLGIDAKDLYVWGYQDNDRGNNRANFLQDAPQDARAKLFPGLTRRFTKYGGNYINLEKAAGVTRRNLTLGFPSLETYIRQVYGKQEIDLNKGNAEARFFLLAIQMVAEASRFTFMQNAIVGNVITEAFKNKMVAFQNDWARISNAIHKAEGEKPKCTTITPTLVISNVDYRQEVTKVNEIKNDMGLLRYKKP